MSGLFGIAVVGIALRATRVRGEDERVKQIDDPSISGLKAPVPLSGEMEDGLAQREREVAERERKAKEAEDRLGVEEARVKERIEELEALMAEIESKKSENRKISDEVLARLVKTFEAMSPKKASGVIATMDDNLAVELIMAMKEKKVAAVLEVMDPNRAMSLSTLAARRRPAGRAVGGEQAR